jgi:hypothetical protein
MCWMCCDFINSFEDCVPDENNTNKMFKKTNEIMDVNMDTVTNNSFLFIINSKTKHAEGLFFKHEISQ